MYHRYVYMICLWGFLFLASTPLLAAQQAGKVISVSGTLLAVAADGRQRELRRRSRFFEGDVLKTGSASRAQIRFLDGAIMALRADTEFRVDSFSFKNSDNSEDKSIGTLIKGGMRTITGVIGKADQGSYRMNTPVATIGVRGTIYEAVMAKELSVAAWQGAITVTNDAGSMELGRGADFNFARIASQAAVPAGLLQPPAVMQQSGVDAGAAPARQEEGDAATSGPTPESKSGGDAGAAASGDEAPVDPATGEPVAPVAAGKRTLQGGDPVMTPEGEGTMLSPAPRDTQVVDAGPAAVDVPMDPALAPGMESLVMDPALGAETTFAGTGLVQDPALTPMQYGVPMPVITTTDTINNALTDLRLAGIDFLPHGGTVVFTGVNAPHALGGPSTIGYIDGSPVITSTNLYPDDPNFLSAPILEVVKGQPSGVFARSSILQIGWGKWNSAKVETDSNDPSVGWVYNQPLYWITFDPRKGDISGLSGGVYSKASAVEFRALGSGSAGSITEANISSFSMNVDFAAATISSGIMNFNNGDAWHLEFSGVLKGPIAELSIDQGSSTVNASNAVVGDVNGGFSGTNAEGFAGHFDVEQMSNPAVHAEGVFHVIRP